MIAALAGALAQLCFAHLRGSGKASLQAALAPRRALYGYPHRLGAGTVDSMIYRVIRAVIWLMSSASASDFGERLRMRSLWYVDGPASSGVVPVSSVRIGH